LIEPSNGGIHHKSHHSELGAGVEYYGANIGTLDSQANKLADLGGNTARLKFCWSRIEPNEPSGGQHNYIESEIQKVKDAVKTLQKRNVYVILDSHQTLVSPYFGKTTCGMPGWLFQQSGFSPSDSVGKAALWQWTSRSFFDNYMAFWKMMVGELKSYPNILGYEIYNEPHGLPNTHAGTQVIASWDCEFGAELQQADPARYLVFQLRDGGDLGFKNADLSCMSQINKPMFDLHAPWWGGDRVYSSDGENYNGGHDFTRVYNHKKWQGHREIICADLQMVQGYAKEKANAPLLVGEFEDLNSKGPDQLMYIDAILYCMEQSHIWYTWWDGSKSPRFGYQNGSGGNQQSADMLSSHWPK